MSTSIGTPNIITELDFLWNDLKIDIKALKNNNKYAYHCQYEKIFADGIFATGQLVFCKKVGKFDLTKMHSLYHFPEKGYYVELLTKLGSCNGCIGIGNHHDMYELIHEQVSRAEIKTGPLCCAEKEVIKNYGVYLI